MKKTISAVIIAFFMTTVFISDSAFAAWTQAKGHSYNQLTLGQYVTKKKFTTVKADYDNIVTGTGGDDIRTLRTAAFVSTSLTYYGEYGLIDELTIFTAIPWKQTESDDTIKYANSNGPSGIGDIDVGLRYNLAPSIAGFVVSLQGTVKIPEAYEYGHPLKTLSNGDGQYDTTLALLLGRGLGAGYAWFNGGYKWRFQNNEFDPLTFTPSDQVRISMGGGYAVLPWLSIRGIIDYTKSVGNAKVSEELIIENYAYGGLRRSKDNVLIRDSLGLEPDAISMGVDLAFSITDKIQTVLSYNRDLEGFDPIQSKDWALGETFNLALVYMH